LKVAVVLLGEYLSHVKKPKEDAVVQLVIQLDVVPESGKNYRAVALWGEKRIEAPFLFPDTLNEALTGLTETISQDVKKPLKAKKILPFLNETPSETAYLRYADGVLALERSDWEGAITAFEEALRSDYNYVQAYAGLAEALAALGATSGAESDRLKAKATMQKAKLLNPYRAKIREERVSWYLKARCGESSNGIQ
jgi:tetratricopeptide (TPR) repeat protein